MANVLTRHNDIPNDLVLITCQHLVVESINSYLSLADFLNPILDLKLFLGINDEERGKQLKNWRTCLHANMTFRSTQSQLISCHQHLVLESINSSLADFLDPI